MNEITQDLVRSRFDYRDGILYWKVTKAQCMKTGDLAGTVGKRGYRQIHIDGKSYRAHRLIFLYHHGYLPKEIDHVDGNKLNNNISNLREATSAQNRMNQKKQKSYNGNQTSSKYKGVTWHKNAKKWMSYIVINNRQKYLGIFTSEIKAAEAYDEAATELFGEFAKLNFDNNRNLYKVVS